MAVLELNSCEMNTDILNDDSRFTEFMTNFFRDNEQYTIRMWDISREKQRHLLEILEDVRGKVSYRKSLEIVTSYHPSLPEEASSSMGVWKKHVRKNRKKAGAGREG